jgi:hypothetical protein
MAICRLDILRWTIPNQLSKDGIRSSSTARRANANAPTTTMKCRPRKLKTYIVCFYSFYRGTIRLQHPFDAEIQN